MTDIPNPWQDIFQKKGHYFSDVQPELPEFVDKLKSQHAKTILDLGCGTGRHVVYLARHGFDAYGMDLSETGLDLTQKWLAQENLKATLQQLNMFDPLPYPANFFDGLISIQVIHHGRLTNIQNLIQEIYRITKMNGLVFISVAKNRKYANNFAEIEPNTFVPLDGQEKGLPHYYFTPETLAQELGMFEIIRNYVSDTDHYAIWAKKK